MGRPALSACPMQRLPEDSSLSLSAESTGDARASSAQRAAPSRASARASAWGPSWNTLPCHCSRLRRNRRAGSHPLVTRARSHTQCCGTPEGMERFLLRRRRSCTVSMPFHVATRRIPLCNASSHHAMAQPSSTRAPLASLTSLQIMSCRAASSSRLRATLRWRVWRLRNHFTVSIFCSRLLFRPFFAR